MVRGDLEIGVQVQLDDQIVILSTDQAEAFAMSIVRAKVLAEAERAISNILGDGQEVIEFILKFRKELGYVKRGEKTESGTADGDDPKITGGKSGA